MKFIFQHKRAYGVDRFYPLNPDAEFLLQLMEVKTVSLATLKLMKENGWDVEINYEKFKL